MWDQARGPDLAVSCLLGPALPEAYRGTMLHCPLKLAGTLGPLKARPPPPLQPPGHPCLPSPPAGRHSALPMTAGLMHLPPASFDGALCHRLCPASSSMARAPATAYTAPHFSLSTSTPNCRSGPAVLCAVRSGSAWGGHCRGALARSPQESSPVPDWGWALAGKPGPEALWADWASLKMAA